ncbi:hypothetical protein CU044_4485 [Streptomyces sp. L-9-10]|nr:hypothetical protein CU044_4485 [Streptomyces sp. L-9-10]
MTAFATDRQRVRYCSGTAQVLRDVLFRRAICRGPGGRGVRSPDTRSVRKSGWYWPGDFDPPQPHLLRPVPRRG